MRHTYCKRGHRLTEANRLKDGRCRICAKARMKVYMRERRRQEAA